MNRKHLFHSIAGAAIALGVTLPALALVNAGGQAWSQPVGPSPDSIKEAIGRTTLGTTINEGANARAEVTTTATNDATGADVEVKIVVFNNKGRRVDSLVVSSTVAGDDPAIVAEVTQAKQTYVPNFPPNGVIALRMALKKVGPVVDHILQGQPAGDVQGVTVVGRLDAPVTSPAVRMALRAGAARQELLTLAGTSTSYVDPLHGITLNYQPANYLTNHETRLSQLQPQP